MCRICYTKVRELGYSLGRGDIGARGCRLQYAKVGSCYATVCDIDEQQLGSVGCCVRTMPARLVAHPAPTFRRTVVHLQQ